MAANTGGVDAGSIYSEVRIQLDKLSGDISACKALFDKIPVNAEKAAAEAKTKVANHMQGMTAAIMAAAGSFAIAGTLVRGIEFNKAAESAQISFGVMLGSAEKAKSMLRELKTFADNTPLEFKDIRQATQTMLQFGIKGQDAIKYIKQLGDVSGGNAEKLQSLTLAFSQISAAGKLQGQDLLQLINAGFNPLKEIAEKTGQSMADLKDQMSKGNVSFEMVAESFKRVTSEGGQFYGMMAENAKSLAGAQSTLNDATDTFLGKLTESFMPVLKAGALALTGLFNALSSLPGPVLAVVGTLAAAAAGFIGLQAAALSVIPALLPVLATLAPFLAIGAAVVAIGAGIMAIGPAQEEYNQKLRDNVKIAAENAVKSKEIIGATEGLNGKQKINAEQVAALIKIYPELSRVLKEGTTSLEEAALAAEKAAQSSSRLSLETALKRPTRDLDAVLTTMKSTQGEIEKWQGLIGKQSNAMQEEGVQKIVDRNLKLLDGLKKNKASLEKEILDLRKSSGLFSDLAKPAEVDPPKKDKPGATDDDRAKALKLAEDKRLAELELQNLVMKGHDDRLALYDAETTAQLEKAKKAKASQDDIVAYQNMRHDGYIKLAQEIDKEHLNEYVKMNKDAATQVYEANKAAYEKFQDTISKVSEGFQKYTDYAMKFFQALKDMQSQQANDSLEILQEQFDKEKELRDIKLEEDLQAVDDETNKKLEAYGLKEETNIESLQRQVEEQKIAGNKEAADDLQLQLNKAQTLKEAEDKKTAINKKAKDDEIAAVKKLEHEKAQLAYETAMASWEMAGLQLQISAALAIMNAWSSGTWVENVIETVAIAAVDIVQTLAWNNAKPKAPRFETGGIVPGSSYSGDRIPAMVNSGEMILNKEQQAQLFDMANGGASGKAVQSMFITVELSEKIIAESVVRFINDGRVRINTI